MTATLTASVDASPLVGSVTGQSCCCGCGMPGGLRPEVQVSRYLGSGRVVVRVQRTGPFHIGPEVDAALRTGAIRGRTVGADLEPDAVVAAMGLSGGDVPTGADVSATVARVVELALAGSDRANGWQVHATMWATRRVLAGTADGEDHAQHAAVWPDPARYRRCRAAVDTLLDALPVHVVEPVTENWTGPGIGG